MDYEYPSILAFYDEMRCLSSKPSFCFQNEEDLTLEERIFLKSQERRAKKKEKSRLQMQETLAKQFAQLQEDAKIVDVRKEMMLRRSVSQCCQYNKSAPFCDKPTYCNELCRDHQFTGTRWLMLKL